MTTSDRANHRSIPLWSCIACGGHTEGLVGHFHPNDDCIRNDLGIEPPRDALTLVYPICHRCARKAGRDSVFGESIEESIISRFRAAIRTGSWGKGIVRLRSGR